jgi:hypothetical protein
MKKQTLLEVLEITIPRRHNTRRNRARAVRHYSDRQDTGYYHEPRHHSADENQVRCAAHLADYIQRGGTLKQYSAWSGCRVRKLSRLLFDFRRHRLPGQRVLAGGVL